MTYPLKIKKSEDILLHTPLSFSTLLTFPLSYKPLWSQISTSSHNYFTPNSRITSSLNCLVNGKLLKSEETVSLLEDLFIIFLLPENFQNFSMTLSIASSTLYLFWVHALSSVKLGSKFLEAPLKMLLTN